MGICQASPFNLMKTVVFGEKRNVSYFMPANGKVLSVRTSHSRVSRYNLSKANVRLQCGACALPRPHWPAEPWTAAVSPGSPDRSWGRQPRPPLHTVLRTLHCPLPVRCRGRLSQAHDILLQQMPVWMKTTSKCILTSDWGRSTGKSDLH